MKTIRRKINLQEYASNTKVIKRNIRNLEIAIDIQDIDKIIGKGSLKRIESSCKKKFENHVKELIAYSSDRKDQILKSLKQKPEYIETMIFLDSNQIMSTLNYDIDGHAYILTLWVHYKINGPTKLQFQEGGY